MPSDTSLYTALERLMSLYETRSAAVTFSFSEWSVMTWCILSSVAHPWSYLSSLSVELQVLLCGGLSQLFSTSSKSALKW